MLRQRDSMWEPVTFRSRALDNKPRVALADLVKVGPEGYIHGYICVNPPCGKYQEALRQTHGGKTINVVTDRVIGRDLKKQPGDAGYSIRYHSSASPGGDVLAGQYATRQDASKAVVLLHNVELLRDTPGVSPELREYLVDAASALRSGKHDDAYRDVMNAAADGMDSENTADRSVAQHARSLWRAIKNAAKPVEHDVSPVGMSPHDKLAARVDIMFARGLTNVDQDHARDVLRKSLVHQAQLVPSVIKNLVNITVTSTDLESRERGGYYAAGPVHSIHVRSAVFDDDAASVAERQRNIHFWVPVSGEHAKTMIGQVAAHEVGHAVAKQVFGNVSGPEGPQFWDDLGHVIGIPRTGSRMSPDTRYGFLDGYERKHAVIMAVSKYASTDPNELLAELWCEFSASDSPRPAAAFYGNYVMNSLATVNPAR